MLCKKLLLLLLNVSICLKSEEAYSKPEILLTKEQLMNIIKKIEQDQDLRETLFPSSMYLSSLESKRFSEIASDEWYEKIIECINNNANDCQSALKILQYNYSNRPESKMAFWQDYRTRFEHLKRKYNQEECQEFFSRDKREAKQAFKDRQYENFRYSMTKLYSFIQGWTLGYILGKNENKFAFVQGFMLAKDPYLAKRLDP